MAVSTSTWRLVQLTLVVYVFGLLQSGYPMGVLNLSGEVIRLFINESFVDQYGYSPSETMIASLYGIANGGLNLGGIAGSFFSGNIANRFGRKFAVFLAPSVASVISAILYGISYATNSFQVTSQFTLSCLFNNEDNPTFWKFQQTKVLIVGRVVCGVGFGTAIISVALYLNEFSPIGRRGHFNGWHTTVDNGWLLISMALSLPGALGTPTLWPYLYSLPAIPGFVFLFLTVLVPETPPYVYVFQNDVDKATALIRKYHGSDSDISFVYEAVIKALKSEMGIRDIWRNNAVRRGFMVGAVLMIGNALTGQALINQFSTSMFTKAGFSGQDASYISMIPAALLVLASIIVPFVSNRYGRRILIFSSLFLQFVGLSTFIICATVSERTDAAVWVSDICIVGVSLATVGYAIGIGPATFMCIPELVPVPARATSMKYIGTIGSTLALVVSLVFPVANSAIGAPSLIPLAIVPQVTVFVFLYFKMPETKLQSEMEIYSRLRGCDDQDDDRRNDLETYGATADQTHNK